MRLLFLVPAILLHGATASADFIIDNFSNTTFLDGVTDALTAPNVVTRSNTNSDATKITNAGGTSTTVTFNNPQAPNNFFRLNYSNFGGSGGTLNLNSYGNLLLGLTTGNTNPSDFSVSFLVKDSSNATASFTAPQVNDNTTTTLNVASSSFTGVNLSQISEISVTFTHAANGNGTLTLNSFTASTATPEPGTLCLVGLSGIAGYIAHRRRANLVKLASETGRI